MKTSDFDVRRTLRTGALIGLKVAVTGGFIWWILAEIDLSVTTERLAALSVIGVALIPAIILVQSVVAAYRWRYITGILGRDLPLALAVRGVLVGLFFSQALPSTVGGDAVRVWRLVRFDMPLGKATASVLLDRIAGLSALLLLTGMTLPLLFRLTDDSFPVMAMAGVVAAGLGGVALAAVLGHIWQMPQRFRVFRVIAGFQGHLRTIALSSRSVGRLAGIGLVIHLLTILVAFVVAIDAGSSISLVQCLVVVPPALLISALPVSIGGWGLREGAFVTGFGFIGIPAADAFLLSVMIGLGYLAVGLMGGGVWLAEGVTRSRQSGKPAP